MLKIHSMVYLSQILTAFGITESAEEVLLFFFFFLRFFVVVHF